MREGGGCLAWFGLPFFAAGCFMALIGIRVVPVVNADEVPAWAWSLIISMGLVFLVAGSVLMFGRRWTVLDKSRRAILKHWGLLVPMRREELSLDDFERVAVRLEAGGSDSSDSYPVTLRCRAGGKDEDLCSSQHYGSSWASAMSVARFLHIPFEDATTDHAVVVNPEEMDGTFRERLRGDNARHIVALPDTLRSQVDESDGEVNITIPGPGFRPSMILGLIIPLGILAIAGPGVLSFFRQTDTPQAVQTLFIGFAVLLLGVLPLANCIGSAVRAARSRTRVVVSADGIIIEERGARGSRTTRVPASEIVGLDFSLASSMLASARTAALERTGQNIEEQWPPTNDGRMAPWWLRILRRLVRSKGITVKSKSGLFAFGAGLADEEVQYLYSVIVGVLGNKG